METWLPFIIKHHGPLGKLGYDGGATRSLAEIEGEVKHSSEGTLAGALAVLADRSRTASWHLTIAKDGRVFQHYPLEAIAWHAGLPGDRRFDTSLVGNLVLIGEEYEGGGPGNMGEPLTAKQLAASVRISEFVRKVCPHVGASPPTLRRNLWEHGWLSPTSCPSGRIPWPEIVAALQEEEMTDEQLQQILAAIEQVNQNLGEAHEVTRTTTVEQATRVLAEIEKYLPSWIGTEARSSLTEQEFATLVSRIKLEVQ